MVSVLIENTENRLSRKLKMRYRTGKSLAVLKLTLLHIRTTVTQIRSCKQRTLYRLGKYSGSFEPSVVACTTLFILSRYGCLLKLSLPIIEEKYNLVVSPVKKKPDNQIEIFEPRHEKLHLCICEDK